MNSEIKAIYVGWGEGASSYTVTDTSIIAKIEMGEFRTLFSNSGDGSGHDEYMIGYNIFTRDGKIMTSIMHSNYLTIDYKI